MNDDCKNMDELRNEEGRIKESYTGRKINRGSELCERRNLNLSGS